MSFFSDSVTRVKGYFLNDAVDDTDRYPWYTPSKEDVEEGDIALFPESISDTELERRYKRYQLVKVIISDVPEDSIMNGFYIYNPDDPGSSAMDNAFQKVYRSMIYHPFLKAVKYCRLFGFSLLYFGYRDNNAPLDSPPPEMTPPAKISKLIPLKKTQVEIDVTETLPREIRRASISFAENQKAEINPSRFIHLENEGFTDDLKGMSVLSPVWDLLTVQKHADWSIGQDMWRGASGLLTLFAAPGATSSDATNALNAVDNLHAKSRLVLPPGWDAKDLSPSRVAYNVGHAYTIVIQQIAAGTRIPKSVFFRDLYAKDHADPEYEGFLASYQNTFLSPLLEQVFKKFQIAEQLPEGQFEIVWRPALESPYEQSKNKFLEAQQKLMEAKATQIEGEL